MPLNVPIAEKASLRDSLPRPTDAMSENFEILDSQGTALGELILRRRRILSLGGTEVFEVKLGEAFLMSSLFHEVEVALSHLGLGELKLSPPWDVVVGGLGLGYTAMAALEHAEVATLLVIDALQPVIDWHQSGLVPLGARLTGDPRTRIIQADFFGRALSTEGFDSERADRKFHAVLLDIDHSPSDLLDPGNSCFYQPDGLRAFAEHIHPGGVFALWSDEDPDEAFLKTLDTAFESVRAHEVTFPNPLTDDKSTSTVYVAIRAADSPSPRAPA